MDQELTIMLARVAVTMIGWGAVVPIVAPAFMMSDDFTQQFALKLAACGFFFLALAGWYELLTDATVTALILAIIASILFRVVFSIERRVSEASKSD